MKELSIEDEARVQTALLHLSYVRSLATVGTSLYLTYPTDEEWDVVRYDPLFSTTILKVAEIANKILDTDVTALTEEKEEKLDLLHLELIDCVRQLAELIDVEPEDLVNVLIQM